MRTVRGQGGFTLAEQLAALAMVGFVMAGALIALQQGQSAYQYGSSRVEVQQSARAAADRLLRDLRTASLVTAATATSVSFQFVDETGTTVTVQYSLVGTDLRRNQTAPVTTVPQPESLSANVTALAFTYYDRNNVATTTPAAVNAVDVRLTTRPQDLGVAQASFEDRVRLRNL